MTPSRSRVSPPPFYATTVPLSSSSSTPQSQSFFAPSPLPLSVLGLAPAPVNFYSSCAKAPTAQEVDWEGSRGTEGGEKGGGGREVDTKLHQTLFRPSFQRRQEGKHLEGGFLPLFPSQRYSALYRKKGKKPSNFVAFQLCYPSSPFKPNQSCRAAAPKNNSRPRMLSRLRAAAAGDPRQTRD